MWDPWNQWRAMRTKRKAAARADAFWQWFAGVSDTLLGLIREAGLQPEARSPEIEEWVNELNWRTAAYHPTVRAVIGLAAGTPELVLTAEGNPAGAEHVRSLVASRPLLREWTIRAFKPAVSVSDCVVHLGAVTLRPDELEFTVIDLKHPDIGERTLLLLFVPGLAGTHSDQVRLAAEKLVEAVVGEEIWLRWNGLVVMEDGARPAEAVARLERQPLHLVPAFLEQIDRDLTGAFSE